MDGLFNPLSYSKQVRKMLCRASNQVIKVWGLESVDKKIDHLIFQQRRINLCGCLTPPLSIFSYGLLVILFHSLQVLLIRAHIHIELILPNEGINKVLPLFYLDIVQPHIPSKGNVTQTILKEVNEQFLVMDHLSHFVAVCFEMSYRALSDTIQARSNSDFDVKSAPIQFYGNSHNSQSDRWIKLKVYMKSPDMLSYIGFKFNINRSSGRHHNTGQQRLYEFCYLLPFDSWTSYLARILFLKGCGSLFWEFPNSPKIFDGL